MDEEDNHRSGGVGKAGLARLVGSRIDSDDPSSLSEITSEPSFDGMCSEFVLELGKRLRGVMCVSVCSIRSSHYLTCKKFLLIQ